MSGAWADGVLAAVSALAASGLTAWFGLLRQSSEEKRWYTEFLLKRRFEAVGHLYVTLVTGHFFLNDVNARVNQFTSDDYDTKVRPRIHAFLEAEELAEIYFDTDTKLIMKEALGAIRQFASGISDQISRVPQRELPNYDSFVGTHERAVEKLRDVLYPEVLKTIGKFAKS